MAEDLLQPRESQPTHDAIARGHEGTEINMRGIVLTMATLGIVCIGTLLVSWVMLSGFERANEREDPPRSPLAQQTPAPPQPWLQPSPPQGEPRQPAKEMDAYRKHEDDQLNSYRVIDRERGIVQIPIERAMTILAAPTTGPATRANPLQRNPEPTGGHR